MYIRRAEINNIRSITHFDITFPANKEAGWHVLIGDNGAGKSTIVKSMALAVLRPVDINATREDWDNWLKKDEARGSIMLRIYEDPEFDTGINSKGLDIDNLVVFAKRFIPVSGDPYTSLEQITVEEQEDDISNIQFKGKGYTEIEEISSYGSAFSGASSSSGSGVDLRKGWFSVAYGPFRRFTGGSTEKERLFKSNPRLGAHLSIFGEDVALSEALNYIRELYIKDLEMGVQVGNLSYIIKFINESNLLPHETVIDKVDSNGVYFRDGNGNSISAVQMSDGFRSVLSLTFELIQQLINVYGSKRVFTQIAGGTMEINLPGIVLIDEIDVHLHPTWQTRIGQWFLKYFPALQFIVTTHSPLVCRACEKGSIWRLAAPGSDQVSGEITGDERDRLIYGNVLDAYGTEVFGEDVSQSQKGQKLTSRVAELNKKSFRGSISPKEKEELFELKAKLPTAQ